MLKQFNNTKFTLISLCCVVSAWIYAEVDTTITIRNGVVDLSQIKEALRICDENQLSGSFKKQIYDNVVVNIGKMCISARDSLECEDNAVKELNALYGITKKASTIHWRRYNSEYLHSQCESDCIELNIFPGIQGSQREYERVYNAVAKKKVKLVRE